LVHLNDQPDLPMPVRIETRWRLEERQLWVRSILTIVLSIWFELTLSETSHQRTTFWRHVAGKGVEDQERAAWRGLVSSHGTGRAAWIFQQYRPMDAPAPPKANASDVILVIPTAQPDPAPAEMAALATYWKTVWLADDDAAKVADARATLNQIGEARATTLLEQYEPSNLNEKPQGKTKAEVQSSVVFLHFPRRTIPPRSVIRGHSPLR
jgi:hypothetical protein